MATALTIRQLCLGAIAAAAAVVAHAGPIADQIFFGGEIVTVNDHRPIVEAVAVGQGKIIAVGDLADVDKTYVAGKTQRFDLQGKTLIPGIIDSHSHFINALGMAQQINVSAPPVGPSSNPDEIVAELKKQAQARHVKPGEMVMGYGYDENLMPPGDPLTRDLLDKAFPDNPTLVMHVSLHGAVLNSAAFAKYGISAATVTPPGGVILRKPGSQEPEGLIMETAFLPVFARLPSPTREQEIEQIEFAQNLYAAAGVTTAQEGATHKVQVDQLHRLAKAKKLFIDVVAYPFITDLDAVLKTHPASTFGDYNNRLKLGGCKITEDGSPQGKTAYFTTPYLTGGPAGEANWRGEPSFPAAEFEQMMAECYTKNLQVLVHANGDAAIDMVLDAHAKVAASDVSKDRRTVVIHSQFVRADQLRKYKTYNLIPSFYTEHTYFFSDTHLLNRGKEQTYYSSPMKSALSMGLRPTNHTDFNVVPINQMMVIWSAVNRTSRHGEVIGPDERISAYDALKAITINAAYQYREEDRKGSIEVGKLADLVVLSGNPLTVEPDAIKDIQVLQTFKEGRSIFRKG